MKNLRRENGFTLVELMVVVAIIGLLSAVAVPNFKKYQAKAKIAEAKLQLSAIYTAETSFFSDYNMYAKCLRYMGYDPANEISNRYYATGIIDGLTDPNGSAYVSAVNSGLNSSCINPSNFGTVMIGPSLDATGFLAGKGIGSSIANNVPGLQSGAPAMMGGDCGTNPPSGGNCIGSQADLANMTFIAGAVGFISAGATTYPTASNLTIDNNKNIKTLVTGY